VQTATIEDIQARLPEILNALAPGDEVVITRDRAPVDRLVAPSELPKGVPLFGRAKGMLIVLSEDDDHLKDPASPSHVYV
jgi:antitoxin (DNA-binding transcriptional repressor) of toxin-antitoxin stability system